jgi:hypothetical protein
MERIKSRLLLIMGRKVLTGRYECSYMGMFSELFSFLSMTIKNHKELWYSHRDI